MGLDQNFYAKVRVDPESGNTEEITLTSAFSDKQFTFGMNHLCALEYEIGYLRKCFAVHQIIRSRIKVIPCTLVELDEKLIAILKLEVERVLKNEMYAKEEYDIPPSDEWVREGLEETLRIIERAEEYIELYNAEIYYSASW